MTGGQSVFVSVDRGQSVFVSADRGVCLGTCKYKMNDLFKNRTQETGLNLVFVL
jgi:hypothetical protein